MSKSDCLYLIGVVGLALCLVALLVGVAQRDLQPQPAQAQPAATQTPGIAWETVGGDGWSGHVERTLIPGGWLVRWRLGDAGSICYYPDPAHQWRAGEGAGR